MKAHGLSSKDAGDILQPFKDQEEVKPPVGVISEVEKEITPKTVVGAFNPDFGETAPPSEPISPSTKEITPKAAVISDVDLSRGMPSPADTKKVGYELMKQIIDEFEGGGKAVPMPLDGGYSPSYGERIGKLDEINERFVANYKTGLFNVTFKLIKSEDIIKMQNERIRFLEAQLRQSGNIAPSFLGKGGDDMVEESLDGIMAKAMKWQMYMKAMKDLGGEDKDKDKDSFEKQMLRKVAEQMFGGGQPNPQLKSELDEIKRIVNDQAKWDKILQVVGQKQETPTDVMLKMMTMGSATEDKYRQIIAESERRRDEERQRMVEQIQTLIKEKSDARIDALEKGTQFDVERIEGQISALKRLGTTLGGEKTSTIDRVIESAAPEFAKGLPKLVEAISSRGANPANTLTPDEIEMINQRRASLAAQYAQQQAQQQTPAGASISQPVGSSTQGVDWYNKPKPTEVGK